MTIRKTQSVRYDNKEDVVPPIERSLLSNYLVFETLDSLARPELPWCPRISLLRILKYLCVTVVIS